MPFHAEKHCKTNIEAEQLQRYLPAENTYEGFCQKCLKRQRADRNLLTKKYSQQEKETYKRMWDSVVLIDDGKGS